MKKLALVLAALAAFQPAHALETVTVKGNAQGPRGAFAEPLYYEAKADAVRDLPFNMFKQVSEWQTSIVDVGAGRFVSATATFEEVDHQIKDDKVTISKSQHGNWSESDLPEQENRTLALATDRAKAICNSDVYLIPPYNVRKRNLSNGETVLTVTARFQCNQ